MDSNLKELAISLKVFAVQCVFWRNYQKKATIVCSFQEKSLSVIFSVL